MCMRACVRACRWERDRCVFNSKCTLFLLLLQSMCFVIPSKNWLQEITMWSNFAFFFWGLTCFLAANLSADCHAMHCSYLWLTHISLAELPRERKKKLITSCMAASTNAAVYVHGACIMCVCDERVQIKNFALMPWEFVNRFENSKIAHINLWNGQPQKLIIYVYCCADCIAFSSNLCNVHWS